MYLSTAFFSFFLLADEGIGEWRKPVGSDVKHGWQKESGDTILREKEEINRHKYKKNSIFSFSY